MRLLFLDNINPLHAVYSLYTSLLLAHKLICLVILFLYALYSLNAGLSLAHKLIHLVRLFLYALYSLNAGLSLAHTRLTQTCKVFKFMHYIVSLDYLLHKYAYTYALYSLLGLSLAHIT